MHVELVAREVVDSIYKVHRHLGPGLLESAYQKCLEWELSKRGLDVQTELPLPLSYDGHLLDCGYRIDMLIEDQIIVENKAVKELEPVHRAQLLTYLRLSGKSLGFLVNWHTALVKDGLHRIVHNHPTPPLPYENNFAPSRLRR